MKILFLTTRVPYPPNQGDKIRTFNILNVMASRHEVDLLTFDDGSTSQNDMDELGKYCRIYRVQLPSFRSKISAGLSLLSDRSLQVAYYASNAFKKKLQQLLAENDYDVVYVHLFRMLDYINEITPYKIVDLTDAVSKEYERSITYRKGLDRFIYSLEAPRIRKAEDQIMKKADVCWAISEADKQNLLKINPRANIEVIPNGINTDIFHPTGTDYNPNQIVFVGHMSVAHNVKAVQHFSHRIFPLIQKDIPDAQFFIIGKQPTHEVLKLDALKNVHVKGFVDDLNQMLNDSATLVAPMLFSAGVQNKMLEAMAARIPVVSSKLGNEGLGAKPDEEILIADAEEEFAQKVIRLMKNKEYREKISRGGYEFVLKNFKWENILPRLSELEKSGRKKSNVSG